MLNRDEALDRARAFIAEPFDLGAGQVLRAACFKAGPGDVMLAMALHHIAGDGISMALLADDFFTRYEQLARGEVPPLDPSPIQYADYAVWHRSWLAAGELNRQLGYWTGQLADSEVLQLSSSDALSSEGLWLTHRFDTELLDALRQFAADTNTTPYVVWLSLYALLLGRLAGQTDVSVGAAVANRPHPELEQIVGYFANTVVQRVLLSDCENFAGLVRHVHEVVLSAQEHQDAPFDQVVDACGVPRDTRTSPLFQAALVYEYRARARSDAWSTKMKPIPVAPRATHDVVLVVPEASNEEAVQAVFRDHVLPTSLQHSWLPRLEHLMRQALTTPTSPLQLFLPRWLSTSGPSQRSTKLGQVCSRASEALGA